MTTELRSRGFDSIIVDRGVRSTENIEMMQELEMKGIMGVKKIQSIKEGILDTLVGGEIYCKDTRIVLKNTTVHAKPFDYMGGKLIVIYNPSLEVHQRERHYAQGGTDEGAKYIGYSLIYHNTGMDVAEVVRQYFEKRHCGACIQTDKGCIILETD
ncbi:MAG: hypothetical protein MSIBF_03585 [Candidatus Altiarchaeales archaeon IMC4]|nr:MAG: hypothetical protein MSIBF_03585 [Candidatus Altiarchaeales archaeon IMC4]